MTCRSKDYDFVLFIKLEQEVLQKGAHEKLVVLGVVDQFLANQNVLGVVDHGLVHVEDQGELLGPCLWAQKGRLGPGKVFFMLVPKRLFGVVLDQIDQIVFDFLVGVGFFSDVFFFHGLSYMDLGFWDLPEILLRL